MTEYLKKLFSENTKAKKILGVILLIIGILALLTPLTPGSWLIFVGLELLGLRFLYRDIFKSRIKK